MLTFTQGNLLDSDAEALVNTVNTVGVMGKGIALMFKEAFPENFRAYEAACKKKEIEVGRMFITERLDLVGGPRWIVNFPTKKHWRHPSKLEWIKAGLEDLRAHVIAKGIRSIALPPLGSGNGGLEWGSVRPLIAEALEGLSQLRVVVYEPTPRYQNVAKKVGVEKLTPARALAAELVRSYTALGLECTLLEVHKLVYFMQRSLVHLCIEDPTHLRFEANRFGPFASNLNHLLNSLDGSYLHSSKRIADAGPLDLIWFEGNKRELLKAYLGSEAKVYTAALNMTALVIDGFESPLGLEVLATVDWLLQEHHGQADVASIKSRLQSWLGGGNPAERKLRLFTDELIFLAIERLQDGPLSASLQSIH
jgi:O-acetyl-ADP-ribose deacetylase (regulator of RNase III)